jgi:hypothetical protein
VQPLCLCGELVRSQKLTTETQRTQRLHREEFQFRTLRESSLLPLLVLNLSGGLGAWHGSARNCKINALLAGDSVPAIAAVSPRTNGIASLATLIRSRNSTCFPILQLEPNFIACGTINRRARTIQLIFNERRRLARRRECLLELFRYLAIGY